MREATVLRLPYTFPGGLPRISEQIASLAISNEVLHVRIFVLRLKLHNDLRIFLKLPSMWMVWSATTWYPADQHLPPQRRLRSWDTTLCACCQDRPHESKAAKRRDHWRLLFCLHFLSQISFCLEIISLNKKQICISATYRLSRKYDLLLGPYAPRVVSSRLWSRKSELLSRHKLFQCFDFNYLNIQIVKTKECYCIVHIESATERPLRIFRVSSGSARTTESRQSKNVHTTKSSPFWIAPSSEVYLDVLNSIALLFMFMRTCNFKCETSGGHIFDQVDLSGAMRWSGTWTFRLWTM